MTASWYRQLGFPNVYAVDGGTSAWVASGLTLVRGRTQEEPLGGYDKGLVNEDLPWGYEEASRRVTRLTPQELQALRQSPHAPAVLCVDTSQEFSRGHVPGAHWVPRGWLELWIDRVVPATETPLVVTCADGLNAVLAGATLQALGYQWVSVLVGGMAAWNRAGLPVERGLSGVMSPPNDVLAMGTDRTWADAINYLRWEEELGKKYETPHV